MMTPEFAEYVARVLADAPPMTEGQAARISALFNMARRTAEARKASERTDADALSA